MRFAPEGAPPEATTGKLPAGVWDLGPDQRYGYAANLIAQLRLRGITVRFADEPDDGVIFMRAYRNDHEARGDEPVELLYLVGSASLEDAPPGYERIPVSGGHPEVPMDGLTVPTAVYVRT